MAIGDRKVLTGTLHSGLWGYSLHMDDGGVWQLDAPGAARTYLSQRVTVEGVRSGYDLIDVHRLRPADDPGHI